MFIIFVTFTAQTVLGDFYLPLPGGSDCDLCVLDTLIIHCHSLLQTCGGVTLLDQVSRCFSTFWNALASLCYFGRNESDQLAFKLSCFKTMIRIISSLFYFSKAGILACPHCLLHCFVCCIFWVRHLFWLAQGKKNQFLYKNGKSLLREFCFIC